MSGSVRSLSGRQLRLEHDDYAADVATVGASLRTLSWRGRPLVRGFAADGLRPVYAGAILAPWPNRVIDGSYAWDGERRQLALSEPARGHALHGLVLWNDFEVLEEGRDRAVLATVIEAQDGYPHRVGVQVEYVLRERGLVTRVRAELLAGAAAPFGWGSHSYLCAPGDTVNEWTLSLPAAAVQTVSAERLIPTGVAEVQGTELDFRRHRVVGETFIDHAFTGLQRDDAGLAHVDVLDAAGVGVRMSWGSECGWVQIHTADRPEPELNRTGLAVEPMTCPPGAFDSATDVIRLEAGTPHTASWRISALG
ncbi:aldose 1-epimerase family protein [Galactobacter valiniphilus]|uniref:aldose 1-epimerase family protein n=1 Tax=Galactobacter valiniphilus TaxID=2676122 RepID=UPI0037367F8E